jgi:hypothetical protein
MKDSHWFLSKLPERHANEDGRKSGKIGSAHRLPSREDVPLCENDSGCDSGIALSSAGSKILDFKVLSEPLYDTSGLPVIALKPVLSHLILQSPYLLQEILELPHLPCVNVEGYQGVDVLETPLTNLLPHNYAPSMSRSGGRTLKGFTPLSEEGVGMASFNRMYLRYL